MSTSPLFIMGIEWIVLVVALIVLLFGAKKIPELARAIGKSTGEFKRGKEESDSSATEQKKGKADEEKIRKAASELGISSEGKNIEEIRENIRKATEI